MNNHSDNMWSAYIDGELTAVESDEFNQSLTDEERDRLSLEIQFERTLGEKLNSEVSCPEQIWSQTLQQIQGTKKCRAIPRISVWSWRIATAAAIIVIGFWLIFPAGTRLPEPAQSVAMLRGMSEVPVTAEAVQQYLNDHGINLVLKPMDFSKDDGSHFRRELLGAREVQYNNERVIELMFACCGEPVEIVLAHSDGRAAEALQQARINGKIKTVRNIGDYYIASLSEHPADEFVELIEFPAEASSV